MPLEVWYCIPTANFALATETVVRWRDMGYKVALLCDHETMGKDYERLDADAKCILPTYVGWPACVNYMSHWAMVRGAGAIVAGGDDMSPDPTKRAAEILYEFTEHFHGTLGVMQPTGDRWAEDASGRAASERICGSPWLGQEWCRRSYGGKGPLWPEYHHFYVDEELKEVAETLGLLWQRPDLTQHHAHWSRPDSMHSRQPYHKRLQTNWDKDKELFQQRKAAGFPNHPLKEVGDAVAVR